MYWNIQNNLRTTRECNDKNCNWKLLLPAHTKETNGLIAGYCKYELNILVIMNSSAVQHVLIVDENEENVAFYDAIDMNITLENFRHLLVKKLANASPTFDFTFKNAPISSTQENFLTLQQVACKLESEINGFKVILKFRNKRHCLTENSHPAKKQQCVQNSPSTSKSTASVATTTSRSKTGVRIFSDSEVSTPIISNFEREKRLFSGTHSLQRLINILSMVIGQYKKSMGYLIQNGPLNSLSCSKSNLIDTLAIAELTAVKKVWLRTWISSKRSILSGPLVTGELKI